MRFFAKIKWVAAILLVFLIVLITNLIDRENYNQLSFAVTTMYEDKLVAKDLIFDMSAIIQKKKEAVLTEDVSFYTAPNEILDQELDRFLVDYSTTRLTNREKTAFKLLQKDINSLREKEKNVAATTSEKLLHDIESIEKHLYTLTKIQLEDAKRQIYVTQNAKDKLNLFTRIEIIFLIITAVLIQVIIFYRPKQSAE